MRRLQGKLLLPVLCLLLLLPCGCSRLRRYSVTYIDLFDTVTTFTAYTNSREEFNALADRVHSQLMEDHRLTDIYREYEGVTNLCTLNRLAGTGTVEIGRDLAELLTLSREMHGLSSGKLNIALGAVLDLWRSAREAASADPEAAALPDSARLREAGKHCAMSDLILEEGGTVRFLDPELKLDVGAVAKGWAQGRARDLLLASGCEAWLLNMGGSVCCHGLKPDGSSWTIGLEDPLDKSRPIRTFSLTDLSAVTSGVDQRFFYADGVRYHHIIDPDTLYPGRLYTQVTVLLPDPALADALSTALFLLDPDTGRALAERFGAEVLWLLSEGGELRTKDFPELN